MFTSCFAQAPVEEHYKALKDGIKLLCFSMIWGLMYWWEKPVMHFQLYPHLMQCQSISSDLPNLQIVVVLNI
jgi:hypothetical protein